MVKTLPQEIIERFGLSRSLQSSNGTSFTSKISDKKDNPGDLPRIEGGLPIALLCSHIAPKEQVGLSPFEMLYGRPFVYVNDLFLDPEAQTLWSYTMAIPTGYTLVRYQPEPQRF